MRALIIVEMAIIITSFTTFSFAFDIDGDGKEGLPEAIHALQVVAGIIPSPTDNATVDDVLKGKTFSNSSATGLEGIRPPAPVERTAQKWTYREGDDGFHQKGVSWPDPRFSAKTNIATDNLTGLMWQRSLNPLGSFRAWGAAVTYCNQLVIVEGSPFGITYEDWRLPNIQEFLSLIDYGAESQDEPMLPPGHPFAGVSTQFKYWSSTTVAGLDGAAWMMWFGFGDLIYSGKTAGLLAWCVRGGN